MNNFIKLLNSFWAGQDYQIIPANIFSNVPSANFSTWAFVDEYSKIINDDTEAEIIDNKVVNKVERYHRATINLKTYSYKQQEANAQCEELRNYIEYVKRDLIVRAGYGIISIEKDGQFNEKLKSGQNIYCYNLRLTFDYNEFVTKENDLLEVVETDGDINKTTKWR